MFDMHSLGNMHFIKLTHLFLLGENLWRIEVQFRLERITFQKKALKVHMSSTDLQLKDIYVYVFFSTLSKEESAIWMVLQNQEKGGKLLMKTNLCVCINKVESFKTAGCGSYIYQQEDGICSSLMFF